MREHRMGEDKDIPVLGKIANERKEINEDEWLTVPTVVAVIRKEWCNPELDEIEFVEDELHSFYDPLSDSYRHVLRFGTAETYFKRHQEEYENLKKGGYERVKAMIEEGENSGKEGHEARRRESGSWS